jgi:prepilin-type processing-associated H-X9-DG protein
MADNCADPDVYFNVTVSPTHANITAARTSIAAFLCPSDPSQPNDAFGPGSGLAPANYAGNIGWTPDTSGPAGATRIGRHNGFIGLANAAMPAAWHTGPVRISQVRDGLSNTAAAAERLVTPVASATDTTGALSAPRSTLTYCGGTTPITRTLSRWKTFCEGVGYPDIAWGVYHGRAWIMGWGHAANNYMHVLPINGLNCHIYDSEHDGNNVVSPSSFHSGGINMLFGDGSVRFVKESVAMPVWWALGTRANGEAISSDAY